MPSLGSLVPRRIPSPRWAVRGLARLVTAVGLAVDAWVHAALADDYDSVVTTFSQGYLFRIEAGLAALAALLVVVWHRLPADVFAFLVAGGGLALLLIYRYYDVGELGPFPNMYEPIWYDDKIVSLVFQAIAVLGTLVLFAVPRRRARHRVG